MRIWGRVAGSPTWVEVSTDSKGSNDLVYLTNLAQVCKLSPNESPFFANYGIPAQSSVIQQIFPDYYLGVTQSQFSGKFAALTISRVSSEADGSPIYNINVVTHVGVAYERKVPA